MVEDQPGTFCLQAKVQNIPALKSDVGVWVYESAGKTDLLEQIFSSKCFLPELVIHEYSDLERNPSTQKSFTLPTLGHVQAIIGALDEKSGTGPVFLPARISRHCRKSLVEPILQLTVLILLSCEWPDDWRVHWVEPILKRGAGFLPRNYQGVHLTAQLSKVIERSICLKATASCRRPQNNSVAGVEINIKYLLKRSQHYPKLLQNTSLQIQTKASLKCFRCRNAHFGGEGGIHWIHVGYFGGPKK